MFEEASDFFDTLSLWWLPKGRTTCWKEEEVLLMWERHRTTEYILNIAAKNTSLENRQFPTSEDN